MHGRWVEMNGQSDHRTHGLCDHDDIISKFAKHGLVVIGLEHPNDTRIIKYAQKIAAQAPQLLDKGAAAERIAVSKHSKGGSIVILAAGLLNDPRINYAILASCGKDGTRCARQQCKRIEKNVQQL